MKRIALTLAVCAAVLASVLAANARFPHGTLTPQLLTLNSQLNPNFLGDAPGTGEYKFLNRVKESGGLQYADFSGWAKPNELDSNGYPLFGSVASTKAVFVDAITPSQAIRPGSYIYTATGGGSIGSFNLNGGTTTGSCSTGVASTTCDNTTCTTISGSISGTTLTVTGASSCPLLVGLPISSGTTVKDQFGVPTVITGMSGSANCGGCTGAGGTGTYLVNWSQTNSGPYHPGIRLVLTVANEATSTNGQWRLFFGSSASGNILGSLSLVHTSDEAKYWTGQLIGEDFKKRVQQGGFGVLRDLNTAQTNLSNVAMWSDRKPATYIAYGAPEMRNSIYIASVGYALNAGSNDYSGTLGGGAPVDKQTVCLTWPSSATNTTVTFALNGTTKKPVLDYRGNGNVDTPAANQPVGLTYDADMGAWLHTMQYAFASCISSGAPPEAFTRLVSEIGGSMNTVWAVMPLNASTPITDYPIQYAKYVQSTYPSMNFWIETPDETWNCNGAGVSGFPSSKSRVYMAKDSFWNSNATGHGFCGPSGDYINWTGFAASLLGQAVHAVSPNYKVIAGVQTVGSGSSQWNDTILSTSYVNQNTTNLPIQSGCAGPGAIQTSCPTPFIQRAAYKDIDYVTIANYWNVDSFTAQAEVASAYCYFYNPGGSCPSQATTMANYLVTASGLTPYWSPWYTFAHTCAGGSGCTPLGLVNYEGGYTTANQPNDVQVGSNASTAVAGPATRFTVSSHGAVVGQGIHIDAASGGTWGTVVGNTYTVTAVPDATHFTVNLDSSGLGTLGGVTLSYVNSAKYITHLRTMTYLEPALYTLETLIYNQISSTGASSSCGAGIKCSLAPSQFNMTGGLLNQFGSWIAFHFDIYGYFTEASCSACTISGTNLTLGGTIKGIFKSGLTILGGGVTTPTTINGACSKTGGEPAGSNAGDVCPLSASSTVASGTTMTANLAPANATQNPMTVWKAICDWNSSPLASGC